MAAVREALEGLEGALFKMEVMVEAEMGAKKMHYRTARHRTTTKMRYWTARYRTNLAKGRFMLPVSSTDTDPTLTDR